MPSTIATSEVSSFMSPLKSPKTKPNVTGIKSKRSRVCIGQNMFGAKIRKKPEIIFSFIFSVFIL